MDDAGFVGHPCSLSHTHTRPLVFQKNLPPASVSWLSPHRSHQPALLRVPSYLRGTAVVLGTSLPGILSRSPRGEMRPTLSFWRLSPPQFSGSGFLLSSSYLSDHSFLITLLRSRCSSPISTKTKANG